MAHDGRLNEQKWRKAYYPSVFQFSTDMAEDTDVLGSVVSSRVSVTHDRHPADRCLVGAKRHNFIIHYGTQAPVS